MSAAPPIEAYFGGPDLPPRALRDLLFDYVERTPEGGAIDWVTYYFRDRELARALLRARHRGVRVRLTLEGHPRTPVANHRVVDLLSGPEGLGDGLRLVGSEDAAGGPLRPRVHEKLYCFSAPVPVAFIGSFNPSGNLDEEEPHIVEAIRDQDRGHNLLVALRAPELVAKLQEHARWLHESRHHAASRFAPSANRALHARDVQVFLLPRARKNPLWARLSHCRRGDRIRVAASHLGGSLVLKAFSKLARRGVAIEILAEATPRRVVPATERSLDAAGIAVRRVVHAEGLPMHAKFATIESARERWVVFGSFNWNNRSLRFNREIGVVCDNPGLFDRLAARWTRIAELAGDPMPDRGW